MKTELRLRVQHGQVFLCRKRFIVLVAGRRWGKTTLALWWLLNQAWSSDNQICYYIGPTNRQAKRIAWRKLKQMIPASARRSVRENELEIELQNGSIIQVLGALNADALRGVGLDAIVLDEFGMMSAGVWSVVVRPMLADRRGRALFIGTPQGYNAFFDLYAAARSAPDWSAFRFRTDQGGYISREELRAIRCETDEKTFRQEYEASFEALQGRVYYAFSHERNVSDLTLIPSVNLLIGMDFNINPMTAVVAQAAGDQCQVIDEIVLPDSNTQEMMDEINRRYRGRRGVVHPDPSGVARKTSAPVGLTDFALIEQAGWPVYKARPYTVVDRITNVNTMLCNAKGERRLLISPNCKRLIRALETQTYKEGTKIPDKSAGMDHMNDALGYLIAGAFPIIRCTTTVQEFLL
jgi:hypothetical protein